MKLILYLVLSFSFVQSNFSQEYPVLRIGLVADPQYAEKPSTATRSYKQTLQKLKQAIDTFNKKDIDLVQNFGDIIDEGWHNYDSILPIYKNLKSNIEIYHLLGNHDFSVDSVHLKNLLHKLSMPNFYYSYEKSNWRFIVLDATDYSFFSANLHNYNTEEIEVQFEKAEGKPNHQSWNSAIGKKQQIWLKHQLNEAIASNQKVFIFSHMPVKPFKNAHNLWNDYEISEIIEQYPNVVAFINGHNHAGEFEFSNGIYYVSLRGMVNTDENSFSILEIHKDHAKLSGYGKQDSYNFRF